MFKKRYNMDNGLGIVAKTVRNIHQILSSALKLATGLRRGELLGLKWEGVDLERGNLRVKRKWRELTERSPRHPPKRKTPTVPCPWQKIR